MTFDKIKIRVFFSIHICFPLISLSERLCKFMHCHSNLEFKLRLYIISLPRSIHEKVKPEGGGLKIKYINKTKAKNKKWNTKLFPSMILKKWTGYIKLQRVNSNLLKTLFIQAVQLSTTNKDTTLNLRQVL